MAVKVLVADQERAFADVLTARLGDEENIPAWRRYLQADACMAHYACRTGDYRTLV
jgi:hypothetical protein